MHAPPPPSPNLDPADTTPEVRPVSPDAAPWFQSNPHADQTELDGAKVVRDFEDLAEAMTEHKQRDDTTSAAEEAATTRLAAEASQPVLDERDQRKRSRTKRQR